MNWPHVIALATLYGAISLVSILWLMEEARKAPNHDENEDEDQ